MKTTTNRIAPHLKKVHVCNCCRRDATYFPVTNDWVRVGKGRWICAKCDRFGAADPQWPYMALAGILLAFGFFVARRWM
jgi:ribosomal protein L37AE/L43A